MGVNRIEVRDVPDPKILNGRDAVVRISSTAICGSDLHLLDGYVPTMEKGDVLGHEFMGEVVEVGTAVGNLKVGDRVVVPFLIACGNCLACERGLYSLCENSNQRRDGREDVGVVAGRHIRLQPYARRLRRAKRSTPRALRRRRADQDRGRVAVRRPGPVPLRHLPDRLHGRGGV